MKRHFSLPYILIYSRLVSVPIMVILALVSSSQLTQYVIAGLMVLAIITDVFDGIIARKMGISDERLRIWDSNVDQIFWICCLIVIFGLNLDFLLEYKWIIGTIVFLEILAYIVSFLRFRRTVATHSILAKFFTLALFVFLIDLCINSDSYFPFWICAAIAIVSRLEMILILVLLKDWATDVPSILAVRKLNKGEPIKRHKLFNG